MTDPASYFVTVHCFGLALSESMSLYGILLKLLAVLALVAANGFFVASEFSLVSVRRTKLEAKARVVAEKRLTEREGFDIPAARAAEDLPPGGPLWAPAPKPTAKAPAQPPSSQPAPPSTAPPPATSPPPRQQPPPEDSTTTTTTPPPSRRPPPPRQPLPVPLPGD